MGPSALVAGNGDLTTDQTLALTLARTSRGQHERVKKLGVDAGQETSTAGSVASLQRDGGGQILLAPYVSSQSTP
jgi:hypothetical protein